MKNFPMEMEIASENLEENNEAVQDDVPNFGTEQSEENHHTFFSGSES